MKAPAPMTYRSLTVALLAAAAVMLPAAGARGQWYSSNPPAPYGSPPQPYAVEVAPNTYVIHRPETSRARPPVRQVEAAPTAEERPRRHADRALIEEMVRRHSKRNDIKVTTVNTTKTVRNKPIVIEHQRVVDAPPRVIERRHITEDAPGRGLIKQRREVATEDVVVEPGGMPREPKPRTVARHKVREAEVKEPSGKRVIRAEAEVTILGPDRMSIRLFRKGRGGKDAKAEVVE